ncbi:MAG: hypothetical protein JWO91_2541, partial [Acidobacteriaceae bacterium]|nr:hypothetical protein [Acidobacteriaceae bacterium]
GQNRLRRVVAAGVVGSRRSLVILALGLGPNVVDDPAMVVSEQESV